MLSLSSRIARKTLLRAVVIGGAIHSSTACAGATAADATAPDSYGVASIQISPTSDTILVGETAEFTATLRSANGSPYHNDGLFVAGELTLFAKEEMIALAATGGSGIHSNQYFTGRAVGATTITATYTEQSKRMQASAQLIVVARPRSAESFLTLNAGYISGFGGGVFNTGSVTWLDVIDASVQGSDYLAGIVHSSAAERTPPLSPKNYPLLSAVAECANGEVYATSSSTSDLAVALWRVDPYTAVGTLLGELAIDGRASSGVIVSMLCDASNSLIFSQAGAGFGNLARAGQANRTTATIFGSSTDEVVLGLAQTPSGTIYATISHNTGYEKGDVWGSPAPEPQLLVTVNPNTGAFTATGDRQPWRLPRVTNLVFRGERLLGRSGSRLVQVNPVTGQVTDLREARAPHY